MNSVINERKIQEQYCDLKGLSLIKERQLKAEHTYQCCQRKIVKKISEDLPDICTAISVLKNQKQYNRVKQKESN
jgi:hypothetical protein